MVRFKVIKGSHLLLGIVIVILAAVIALMAMDYFADGNGTVSAQANLVENIDKESSEAETDMVFASLGVQADALELDPGTDMLEIEIISEASESKDGKPSVLIYHTHTHEAYEQVAGDRYVAIEAWRTNDQDHSVVRVGEELAKLLRQHGFDVVHDVTDNEQAELSTAYTRSMDMLEGYEQRFDLYIDLHRDAYIEGVEYAQMTDGEKPLAQMMLLIGNGVGFDTKPYYEQNLAFATHLTERINAVLPGLCRDVLVKDGRYNQSIGVFSILVEVGHNRNTLQEALNALPYLAQALHSLMIEEPVPALVDMQKSFIESGDQSSNSIIS